MSTALLFTDCQDKNLQLQRKIGRILPCKVAPLHDTMVENARADVVVSDVALDSPVVTEMLHLALDKYREEQVPILFLLHDVTAQSIRNALSLGADKILDADCPQHMLTEALSALLSQVPAAHQAALNASGGIAPCVACVETMFRGVMEAAQNDRIIAPEAITAGAQSVLQAIQNRSLRAWLDVVWTYDDTTYQHGLLVAGLAASFSLKLGFSERDRERLTGAALLHDVGKAGIPKEILNKPARLTDAEMNVMRTHPVIGADLLLNQRRFSNEIVSVVRHHHEFLDGSRYPDGLRAHQISDLVRMTTICDVYAALVERRPYRDPMSMPQAFAVLSDMKGKLDPHLVRAFEIVVCDA